MVCNIFKSLKISYFWCVQSLILRNLLKKFKKIFSHDYEMWMIMFKFCVFLCITKKKRFEKPTFKLKPCIYLKKSKTIEWILLFSWVIVECGNNKSRKENCYRVWKCFLNNKKHSSPNYKEYKISRKVVNFFYFIYKKVFPFPIFLRMNENFTFSNTFKDFFFIFRSLFIYF